MRSETAKRLWAVALTAATLACTPQAASAQDGTASFYHVRFEGRLTASGSRYHGEQLTIAHRTLPLGTVVLIENLSNHATSRAIVTDRGPFVSGRIADLSMRVARELKMISQGLARVRIKAIAG